MDGMTDEQRAFLAMGPTVHFIVEHVPTVERRDIRGIEWFFRGDNRVVSYSNKGHQEVAQKHGDYRTLMQLAQLGFYDVSVEPRWDIEPRQMLPHERGELDEFRAGQRAHVEYSEVTWRITDKGRKLLAALNPPPKPKFRIVEISEHEAQIVME